MHRWWKNLIIVTYLGMLSYGLVVHALKIEKFGSIANYFLVWDMYCGWSSFETRGLLVAEGESGQLYNAAPPWKELSPFGSAKRHDYDTYGIFSGQVAANTLKHTQHEPIVRIMLVEQLWSKKYNLPDHLWEQRFDTPRTPRNYYYIRTVFDSTGAPTTRHFDWESNLTYRTIVANPALRSTVARTRPYIVTDQLQRGPQSTIQQTSFEVPSSPNP